MKDYRDIIRKTARSFGVLRPDDTLELDSLTMIDLVLALEEAAGVQVPTERLLTEHFRSVDSIANLLATL